MIPIDKLRQAVDNSFKIANDISKNLIDEKTGLMGTSFNEFLFDDELNILQPVNSKIRKNMIRPEMAICSLYSHIQSIESVEQIKDITGEISYTVFCCLLQNGMTISFRCFVDGGVRIETSIATEKEHLNSQSNQKHHIPGHFAQWYIELVVLVSAFTTTNFDSLSPEKRKIDDLYKYKFEEARKIIIQQSQTIKQLTEELRNPEVKARQGLVWVLQNIKIKRLNDAKRQLENQLKFVNSLY